MITHIALFQFDETVGRDHLDKLATELRAFATSLPWVVEYRCGVDDRIIDGSWDFYALLVVDSEDDLHRYLESPEHVEIAQRMVVSVLKERRFVEVVS